MADAIAEVMQSDPATKADVLTARSDLTSEMKGICGELREIERRLEAKIEATKSDLIKWLVGVIGFQTAVLLGAALALARAVAR